MFNSLGVGVVSMFLTAVLAVTDVMPMARFLDAKTINSSGTFTYEIASNIASEENIPIRMVEGKYLLNADLTDLEDPRLDLIAQADIDMASYDVRLLIADKAVFTDVDTVKSTLELAKKVIDDETLSNEDAAMFNKVLKEVQALPKSDYQMVKIADLKDTNYQSIIEGFNNEQEAGKEIVLEMMSLYEEIFKGFKHDSITKTEKGIVVSLDREASADLVNALYASYASNRSSLLPRMRELEKKINAAQGYTDAEQESFMDTVEPTGEADAVKSIVDWIRNTEFECFDDYKFNYEMSVQDDALNTKASITATKDDYQSFVGSWNAKTVIREVEIKAPVQSISLDELFDLIGMGN